MGDKNFKECFFKNIKIVAIILLIWELHVFIDLLNGIYPDTNRIFIKFIFFILAVATLSYFQTRSRKIEKHPK